MYSLELDYFHKVEKRKMHRKSLYSNLQHLDCCFEKYLYQNYHSFEESTVPLRKHFLQRVAMVWYFLLFSKNRSPFYFLPFVLFLPKYEENYLTFTKKYCIANIRTNVLIFIKYKIDLFLLIVYRQIRVKFIVYIQ